MVFLQLSKPGHVHSTRRVPFLNPKLQMTFCSDTAPFKSARGVRPVVGLLEVKANYRVIWQFSSRRTATYLSAGRFSSSHR